MAIAKFFILAYLLWLASPEQNTCVFAVSTRNLAQDEKYVINVHDSLSAIFSEEFDGNDEDIQMSTRQGEKFKCYFPSKPPDKHADGLTERERTTVRDQLLRHNCLHLSSSSVVYELCPQRYLRIFGLSVQDSVNTLTVESTLHLGIPKHALGNTPQPFLKERYSSDGGADAIEVKYACSGRDPEFHLSDKEHSEAGAALDVVLPIACSELFGQQEEQNSVLLAKRLLQPLFNSGSCLLKHDGWWTYELCPGKFLRQYHRDKDGSVTDEYVLGEHDDQRAQDDSITTETWVAGGTEISKRVFRQIYVKGSACDETGKERDSEVFFSCSPYHQSYISSIQEVKTCGYRVHVSTSLLCSAEAFRDARQPNEFSTRSVHCLPILDESLLSVVL